MFILRKIKKRIRRHKKKTRDIKLDHANRDFGFMHVGKTGGSSVGRIINKSKGEGYYPPVKFGHTWTLKRIIKDYPQTKLSFTFRDPAERFVSAFNYRIRSGQINGSHDWRWNAEEAVSYLWFENAADLLQALCGDCDRKKAAAHFAFKAITHLKRNYEFFFQSVDFLQEHRDRFYFFCETSQLSESMEGFFSPCAIPPEVIHKYSHPCNVSPTETGAEIQKLDPHLIEGLRALWAKDFQIYEFLRAQTRPS